MDPFGLFVLLAPLEIGIAVALVVRLLQLVIGRIRGRPFSRGIGPRATMTWAFGFALTAFAAAGFMSIGILVLPFAIIACGIAAWRCRAIPEEAIGASLGIGAVLLVVGLANPTPLPGHGVNGTSWLPVAVALIVLALASQILTERRNKRPGHIDIAPPVAS